MTTYFLMDSRASYDVDEAQVLEVYNAKSDRGALSYFHKHWGSQSCVLCKQNPETKQLEVINWNIDDKVQWPK